jgi:hypothetical protein
MEEARRAPLRVMHELRAMVAGMGSEVDSIMEGFRKPVPSGASKQSRPRRSAVLPLDPPSSNTGVLVPPVPSYPKSPRAKKPGGKA